MDLSSLSAEEFITHLLMKMESRSWTPAEFVEAEQRGEGSLDANPELGAALWAEGGRIVAPIVEAFRTVFEPTHRAITQLACPAAVSLAYRSNYLA
jgi:hypothetical protein